MSQENIAAAPRPTYVERVEAMQAQIEAGTYKPGGQTAENIVRGQYMNELEGEKISGLAIARRNARVMRADMAAYKEDPSKYTKSLGAATGYGAMQYMKAAKETGQLHRAYIYGSGWQWAAMRNKFAPKPDISSHEKTAVVEAIDDIYRGLHGADEVEKLDIFKAIDDARAAGDEAKLAELYDAIDNYESHIRPITADIDAGFGDANATYNLAKKMIEAGASCIQLENQVSEEKQCGHQDGKVTVPREEYLSKLNAVRQAFNDCGIPEGVVVARTDSLGAGLTKDIAPGNSPYAASYNKHIAEDPVTEDNPERNGDVFIQRDGNRVRLKRNEAGLFEFKEGTNFQRATEDAAFALMEAGADSLWIETAIASLDELEQLTDEVKRLTGLDHVHLTYNNSPSFAWTLKTRQEVLRMWRENDDPRAAEYEHIKLEDQKAAAELGLEKYSGTTIDDGAREYINQFQREAAKRGVGHHLITLPEFHGTGLKLRQLAREYFDPEHEMSAYVHGVQDVELAENVSIAKHQHEVGSDVADWRKRQTKGESANVAAGALNTMNEFTALADAGGDAPDPAANM